QGPVLLAIKRRGHLAQLPCPLPMLRNGTGLAACPQRSLDHGSNATKFLQPSAVSNCTVFPDADYRESSSEIFDARAGICLPTSAINSSSPLFREPLKIAGTIASPFRISAKFRRARATRLFMVPVAMLVNDAASS